jgi:hypothetical protein
MAKSRKWIHLGTRVCAGIFLLLAIAGVARPQAGPDFSGLWQQDNDRCQPKRGGDVTLRIAHRGPQLTIETTILRGAQNSRHAVQKYTTDGTVSVSTGADGDEFHTSVVWNGPSLVFSIEEHEDGRILLSKETWQLVDDGAAIQRTRERANRDKEVLFYRRRPPGSEASSLPGRAVSSAAATSRQ